MEAELAALREAIGALRTSSAVDAERVDAAAAISRFGDRLIELRDQAHEQAGLTRRLDEAVGSVRQSLETLHQRVSEIEASRGGSARRVIELSDRAGEQQEIVTTLRSALANLESRFVRHVDDATRTATALLERLELEPDEPERSSARSPA